VVFLHHHQQQQKKETEKTAAKQSLREVSYAMLYLFD